MSFKRIFAFILSAVVGVSAAPALSSAEDSWELVWSDEFDGAELDMGKWSYELGNWKLDENGNYITGGWGNNEQEFYTDSNASVSDGVLTIAARHENYTDPVQGSYEYTSARLSTQYKFSTCGGRIEVRARCDSGKSLWPAIWMLPEDSVYGGWAASGEIDIMEGWGSRPNEVCGTIHFGDVWPNNTYLTGNYTFPEGDSSAKWHTYAVEWSSERIDWFVDDVLYSSQTDWYSADRQFPAPFDQNFYVILNLAVGGHFDGVDGIYGDPATFAEGEKHFDIDYVRVYRDNSSDFTPPDVASLPLSSYIESSDAVMKNLDGRTEFDIESLGSLEYGVMGLVTARKVRAGETWRLSFGADATVERSVVVTVEDGDYQRYLDEKIAVTNDRMRHSFDVTFDSDMSVDLKFQLGNVDNAAALGSHRVVISGVKWDRVTDELCGDVNGDGSVSVADLVLLSRYLLGEKVGLSPENADISGDGRVDSFDLVELRRLLLN